MILLDNAMQEEARLTLVNSLSYKTIPAYNWWDGWWRVGPRNAVEHALYLLWRPYIESGNYPTGIEYWSRKLVAPNHGLAWHQDTNEKEFSTDNYEIAGASMTYYTLVEDLVGGNLELYPYDDREKGNGRLSIQNYLKAGNLRLASNNLDKFKNKFNKDLIYSDGSSFIENMDTILDFSNEKNGLDIAIKNSNKKIKSELKRAWYWSKN